MRLTKILFILFLLSSNCFAATWYLSPTGNNTTGDGSSGNPWFSPAKARKGNSDVAPGDTVIFKNGTYTYGATDCLLGYYSDDAGSSGNVITYQSEDTTHSVILDFSGNYGFRLNDDYGSDYITLDGFIMRDIGFSGGFLDDTHQTVRNCWITSTDSWPPSGDTNSASDGGGGVNMTESATDFLVEDCIMDEVAYTVSSHGVYCGGGSGVIRDCIMRNNLGNGVQIQSGGAGHVIGDIDLYRCKIYGNTGRHGIYSSSYSGGEIGTLNIYNNLLWDNGDDYASGFGITVSNTSTYTAANIWNNTLWDNHYGLNNSTVSGTMRNNIAIANGTADISSATITNSNLTRSNNLTTDGDEGNGVSGSFAVADVLSTTYTDPVFLWPDKSNNAITGGTNLLSEFTTDFNGNNRNSTNFGIGAIIRTGIWYIATTGSNTTGFGTSDSPWFSPEKAAKSSSDVAPGDTVIFKNGTYEYDSDDCALGGSNDDAGSSGNVITYQAEDTTHSVILDFNEGWGWRLGDQTSDYAAYITLDGFVIVNTLAGVRFMDSNQTAKNIYATGTTTWPQTGTPGSYAQSGGCLMTYQGATDFLFEDCIADNCGYNTGTEETPAASSHGLYLHSGNGIVRDSIFRNNIGCGMQVQAGEATFQMGSVYLYRNKSHDNGAGIYCSAYGGGAIEGAYFYNNFIWNIAIGRDNGYGITINGATASKIENNTLYNCRVGINSQNTTGTMYNNIIVNSTSDDISYGTSTNTNLTKGYNLTTDGDEGSTYGVIDSFATTGFQSTTASSDDFLKIDASNNAIDTGYDLSGTFTDDYFANERTGTWDIGAHEYEAVSSTPTITVGAGTIITVGAGTTITMGAN